MFFLVAAWSVWTCVLFLPELHERYAFMLEILLVIIVFIKKSYVCMAVPAWFMILFPYCWYLFGREPDLRILAVGYFASYCGYTGMLLKELGNEKEKIKPGS